MAYTIENNYTGNGTTRLYSFTFPYLEDTDVKVSLNQVDTTNFEFANATQINFTADAGGATSTQEASGAPKSSVAIRVYRDTNIDNLQGEFFSGSAIRAQDLNNDFNQTLYVSQETQDKVTGMWNDTTETLDSTEAFVDSNDYIMTAAAIDDRIIAKQAARALADGKIIVGNGSGVGAQVTPSGDVTMANTGAFTIASGSVETAMIAADAVSAAKLADNAVDSEHYVDGSIDTVHLSTDAVTGAKIADNAIDSEHYTDGSIDAAHIATDAVTTAKINADAVTGAKIADDAVGADQLASDAVVNASVASGAAIAHSKLASLTDTQILVGNGSNVPTGVAVSGDVTIANTGAVTIAANAVEIGMIGCEQTTISDSDSHIPTSGAVVDYVSSVIAPIGGLEVIADDESFPNTIPAAGVVISITDCAGLSVNSSGVSTNGDALDNSTITINGFPSELRGGVGSNADPYVFGSGAGLMVVSTGSSQTYNYHQAMIRESDFVQLSDDINDFNSRYRVYAGEPSSNNDDGDMVWDTNADKMKVYDATASAWSEVTSTGDFKFLVPVDAGTTTAASWDGSDTSFDLKETTNSGSAASVTNVNQLIVSLNGVIQKPNTGTYSGSEEGFYLTDADTIRFCDAPPSGSAAFILQCGSAVSIPTPGDGTVTAAKIGAGAVTAAKIGTSAVETAKINADAVTGAKIADDAIDSEHYTDGSIDTAHIADNQITLAKMAGGTDGQIITYDASGDPVAVGPGTDGQVLTSTGAGSPPAFETISTSDTLSFRRINHNGDCSVAQRGTVTSLTSGYGGPDRYKLYSASHGTYTASQELDAPDGFDQSLKILNTAADTSIASSARLYVQHKIEKYDLIRTKKGTSGALSLTAQFWVKSDKTGTYIFEMWDNQNNRHISSTYTISSADTWEKKTMTFAGDTSGNAFAAANTSGIDCNWWLAAGSNFTSGSLASSWTANTDTDRAVGQTVNIGDSGNWYMTGFQLETGSTATDFEYKSYAEELQRCLRYYYRTGNGQSMANDTPMAQGYNRNTTTGQYVATFPLAMRVPPTAIETTGTATDYKISQLATATTCDAVPTFDTANTLQAHIYFTVASGLTAGYGSRASTINGAGKYIAFSAEL